jgi:hypothetical protein
VVFNKFDTGKKRVYSGSRPKGSGFRLRSTGLANAHVPKGLPFTRVVVEVASKPGAFRYEPSSPSVLLARY